MKRDLSITGLDDDDRAFIGDALTALRENRAREWNTACDRAREPGRRDPPLREYGIDQIRRLARRLGTRPTHWAE